MPMIGSCNLGEQTGIVSAQTLPEIAHIHAQFPAQPHPNCGCYSVARLMDTNEFVADLKRWSKGEDV